MSRAIAFTLLLCSAVAAADPADEPPAGMAIPDKARFLADRGRQLQRDGKFAAAIEAYKAAYVLAPSPGLLFNLAQVYRLNGDCDDAAKSSPSSQAVTASKSGHQTLLQRVSARF